MIFILSIQILQLAILLAEDTNEVYVQRGKNV